MAFAILHGQGRGIIVDMDQDDHPGGDERQGDDSEETADHFDFRFGAKRG